MNAFFQIVATLAALRLVLAFSSDPENGVVLAASRHGARPAFIAAVGLWTITALAAAVAMALLDLLAEHAPGHDLELRIVCGLHMGTLALRSVVDAFRARPAPQPVPPASGHPGAVLVRVLRSALGNPNTILLAGAGFGLTGAWGLEGVERLFAILVMPTVALVWHLVVILPLAPIGPGHDAPRRPRLHAAGR